jgi:Cu/Ag efflux protein CusF
MHRPARLLLASLALAALPAGLAAAEGAAPKAKADAAPRHAIKGVVTGHYAERQSLIIKHEEIPGVMRAMTMAFKVDEATFKAAKQGDQIAGQMSREPDGWRLHDVKLSPPPPASK